MKFLSCQEIFNVHTNSHKKLWDDSISLVISHCTALSLPSQNGNASEPYAKCDDVVCYLCWVWLTQNAGNDAATNEGRNGRAFSSAILSFFASIFWMISLDKVYRGSILHSYSQNIERFSQDKIYRAESSENWERISKNELSWKFPAQEGISIGMECLQFLSTYKLNLVSGC